MGQEESNNKISYDLEHRISERPMKKTKQILANMALEDLLGKDYMDLNDYYVGGKGDDDESNADDDDFDWVDPIVDGIYSWEVCIVIFNCLRMQLKVLRYKPNSADSF